MGLYLCKYFGVRFMSWLVWAIVCLEFVASCGWFVFIGGWVVLVWTFRLLRDCIVRWVVVRDLSIVVGVCGFGVWFVLWVGN